MEIKQDHVEPIDINYAVDPNFQDEQLLSPECCSATYNWQQASMFSFKPLDQEHPHGCVSLSFFNRELSLWH